MAKANFVKAAQKNIYVHGKNVEYLSEKGKLKGQMKSKLDRTQPRDENDAILIAKGEPYYWWQFMNGGKRISKERPRPSQLTQSSYLSQLYSIQETLEDANANDWDTPEDVENFCQEITTSLEELRDETQDSLDNMPDSLQYSPTGELLQERIDALESAISELECMDFQDYEEPEEDGESLDDSFNEWATEKLDEMQNISFE